MTLISDPARIGRRPTASRRGRGLALVATALATAAAVAACGDSQVQSEGATVTQRITRDFGREMISVRDRASLGDRSTVLDLLRSEEQALLSPPPGRWVIGIDGLRSGEAGSSATTWALNVNGIESDTEPGDYRLHPGDVVQWDYRDWFVLFDVRATVGAFPQTFTRGMFGARFPTTVECVLAASQACRLVRRVVAGTGVDIDGAVPPGPPPRPGAVRRARILVGAWQRLRQRPWPRRIDRGPRYSGVFARFSKSGRRIQLLDWDGQPARTAGPGSGLVAAMRPTEEDLLWVVTGVDDEGVERAARALTSPALRDAFALVVTRDGAEKVPLPLADPDGPRERVID